MSRSRNCKEAQTMRKKRISPGEKVPLKLTPTEVKAILDELMCMALCQITTA
jgi:hypothetical protein